MTCADFLQQARSNWGAQFHPGIDFAHDFGVDRGHGAMALEDLPEGELILRMPIDLTLGPEFPVQYDAFAALMGGAELSYRRRSSFAVLREYLHSRKVPELDLTALLLLHEVGRGKTSEYAAYIAVLPHTFPTSLLSFTKAEQAALRGTSLEDGGTRWEASLTETFAGHILPLMLEHPESWPEAVCNLDHYMWAITVVTSRAFTSGKFGPYLVPVADMFNHCTFSPHAELETDVEHRVFELRTQRAVSAGEEILASYGCLSTSQLLRAYGFVEPLYLDNPYDSCTLEKTDLIDAALQILNEPDVTQSCPPKRLRSAKEAGNITTSGCSTRELLLRRVKSLQRAGLLCDGRVHFAAERAASDDRLFTICLLVVLLTCEEFADYTCHCPKGSVLTLRPSSDAEILNQVEEVDGLYIVPIPHALYVGLLQAVRLAVFQAMARFPGSRQADEVELRQALAAQPVANHFDHSRMAFPSMCATRCACGSQSGVHSIKHCGSSTKLLGRPMVDKT